MEGSGINMRRKVLTVAISNLLTEIGYETAESIALETLAELLQSFLTELGGSTRSYCEIAGRTEPLAADVIMALVGMGFSLDGIIAHAQRPSRTILPAPSVSVQPKALTILQAGVKQTHPSHVPAHLPAFPDPHAYIRTPTHKQPVTEYEAIREKSASQKRDLERALTRFVAKTGETHSLFDVDDASMFPLVACKPEHPAYLKALLPQDQVFDFEEDFGGQGATPPRPPRRGVATGGADMDEDDEDQDSEGEKETEKNDPIDNPYLRPVMQPRK